MGSFNPNSGESDDDPRDLPETMPWDIRPSIYDHLSLYVVPDQPGLQEPGYQLPDEGRFNGASELRWAAGALDGVLTHHSGGSTAAERVQKTVSLLLACCDQPTVVNKYELYQHILAEHIVALIDAVITQLLSEPRLNHERLYELVHSFATESPDREAVKFGIAILGLYQVEENTDLFLTLGRHDEFTLFCAVALTNIAEDPEQALWELARNVDGWGRIHAVERLVETENSEIKDWLLRDGFRNSVLNEYLAFSCATTGGLLAALSEPQIDRELLTSAGELIEALINGGPAEDMDDYHDGADVVARFLEHVEPAAQTLADFLHVRAIQQFLSNDSVEWGDRAEQGWSAAHRQDQLTVCRRILDRPEWPDRVHQALDSTQESEFFEADQVARILGISTWDQHWKRLQSQPLDPVRWFHLMLTSDETKISQVLEFAEQQLDLNQIASGADNVVLLGEAYRPHHCLDYILQELRRFPQQGTALIEAGLNSPVVSNRNLAVAALAGWGDAARSFEPLIRAAAVEPQDTLRQNMQKILNGELPED